MPSDCIFCKIAQGEAEAKVVYQDDLCMAFWDRHPVAPVHILIIPKKHIASVNAVEEEDEKVLGHLIHVARKVAKDLNVNENGFRLSINTGDHGGQSVYHIHVHLIGGRPLPIYLG